MGATDALLAAAILAATGWWLWRSLWKRGPCAGCSGGGCGARAEAPAPGLVRLRRR